MLALFVAIVEPVRAAQQEPAQVEVGDLAAQVDAGALTQVEDAIVVGDGTLGPGRLTTVGSVTFAGVIEIALDPGSRFEVSSATFRGPVTVSGTGSTACDRCLTGENVSFLDRVRLQPNRHQVELVDSTFLNQATFEGSFSLLACRACFFAAPARFVAARVDRLDFRDTVFGEPADFTDATITKPRLSCLRGKPIYLHWSAFGERWMETTLEEAQGTEKERKEQLNNGLQCWRDNLQSLGLTSEAMKANYASAKVTRDLQPLSIRPWFREITDGYGTRPLQPLVVSAIAVVVFGILFWIWDPFIAGPGYRDRTPKFFFALAFSLETFIPIFQVTGIKRWGWSTTGRGRWLEVSEAVIGGFLTLATALSATVYL